MTTYQGGKKRIGKRIAKVIDNIANYFDPEMKMSYFEPFCGMCGVLQHVNRPNKTICDFNSDLLLLLSHVKEKGIAGLPNECSKEEWHKFKTACPSPQRSFIGIVASWSGIFFQGYRLDYKTDRNYLQEGLNGLAKLQPSLVNVEILPAKSYTEFKPRKMIIYCDPPYQGNQLGQKGGFFQGFNHEEFWEKMRQWSVKNIVLISETVAPDDFISIWKTQSHINNSNRYGVKRYCDNIFVHKAVFDRMDDGIREKVAQIR